jgi:hypothetical protein
MHPRKWLVILAKPFVRSEAQYVPNKSPIYCCFIPCANMEALFALSNLRVIDMVDQDGQDLKIAYNQFLLEKRVLISMYEQQEKKGVDDNVEPMIDDSGKGEDDDEPRSPFVSSFIVALTYDDHAFYTHVLFSQPMATPWVLWALIAERVAKHVCKIPLHGVVDALKEIAVDTLPSNRHKTQRERQKEYDELKWIFTTFSELTLEHLRGLA